MKRKLICAATLGAFMPPVALAQAADPSPRPSMMVYWEVPLDAAKSRQAQTSVGLRIDGGPYSIAPPSPIAADPASR